MNKYHYMASYNNIADTSSTPMFRDMAADVLKGNITGDGILEICPNKEEYNRCILDIMSIPIGMCIEEEQTEDVSERSPIESTVESTDDEESDLASGMKSLLEEYYKIDNCPSFLYHNGMLNKEDYRLGIEIYSRVFELEYEEGCSEILKQVMEEYTRKIVRRTIEWKSEEGMMEDLFHL